MFLEESKYIVNEKKMPKYNVKGKEISPDESDKEDFDEENTNKVILMNKILMNKSRLSTILL